jgi:hypothetical protein|tara:strand:- start:213 stop:458 length:246 start_codon:yes stop_codon:yes gene_type:complete
MNDLLKEFKFLLNEYKTLIGKIAMYQDWMLDGNKKIMKLETTNHYLEWQNSYFKGFIKRHGLDNKLHEKDDEAIKEDVKND